MFLLEDVYYFSLFHDMVKHPLFVEDYQFYVKVTHSGGLIYIFFFM